MIRKNPLMPTSSKKCGSLEGASGYRYRIRRSLIEPFALIGERTGAGPGPFRVRDSPGLVGCGFHDIAEHLQFRNNGSIIIQIKCESMCMSGERRSSGVLEG